MKPIWSGKENKEGCLAQLKLTVLSEFGCKYGSQNDEQRANIKLHLRVCKNRFQGESEIQIGENILFCSATEIST